MGLFESMATSKDLENKGIWLDLEHSRILLARAGGSNVKYNMAAEKLAREHKRVFALDLMTSAKGKQLLHTLYADTVVLDWLTKTDDGTLDEEGAEITAADYKGNRYIRGIGRPDNKVVEVNKPNVIETFVLIEDLFVIVKDTAESLQFFKQSLVDGVAGN